MERSMLAWLSEKVQQLLVDGIAPPAIEHEGDKGLLVPLQDRILEQEEIDEEYPGTAVKRMKNIQERTRSMIFGQLNGNWAMIRQNLLWAEGLKDSKGLLTCNEKGYTGYSFNDFNHCDLTAMRDDNENSIIDGHLPGIPFHSLLAAGIRIASETSLGPGGSWNTCMIGCSDKPPSDMAHVQFQARIAFKLVWVPYAFSHFVLVDDGGKELNHGSIIGHFPFITDRAMNYRMVYSGSKYAKAAERIGGELMAEERKRRREEQLQQLAKKNEEEKKEENVHKKGKSKGKGKGKKKTVTFAVEE